MTKNKNKNEKYMANSNRIIKSCQSYCILDFEIAFLIEPFDCMLHNDLIC